MILAVIQARFSSRRLPGKVLQNLGGKPMLAVMIERLLRSKKIDKLIVATSRESSDDGVEKLCKELNLVCYRGSLDNVLARFYNAALAEKPDHILRFTGDCPLIDVEIVDALIEFYMENGFDYASNNQVPTYPDGMDAEVFRFSLLEKAFNEATLPSEKEHVTPFMYKEGNLFNTGIYKCESNLSHLRFTVDEPSDMELVRAIYADLAVEKPHFGLGDILSLLEKKPELLKLNSMFKRNEGYLESLKKDEIFFDDTR